ncbi:MAG: LysR substrate-binding domain-containing protein [Polyangiaceae bacterium]
MQLSGARDLLRHLPVVLSVAQKRSFTAAARELGMTPSAVSHAVRQVERGLGVALFARTTRSVSLTEAGHAFVAAAEPALTGLGEELEFLRLAASGEATGLLRLNVPRVALPLILTPLALELARRHPKVQLEIFIDDGLADIVAQGFDAGVRLGEMIQQDMVAVRLTPPLEAIVVGSPTYFRANPQPETLADLAAHRCIGYREVSGGGLYRWEFQEAGEDRRVEVRGPLIVNDALYAADLAEAHQGLAYLFAPLVQRQLACGSLVRVLERHSIVESGLFLYFPQRISGSPKMRALLECARALQA